MLANTQLDATMILLADGRFPSGGHAHSNGYEAAATLLSMDSVGAVEHYLGGRLTTSGRTEAALVAATVTRVVDGAPPWRRLDDEVTARLPNEALRRVSRSLGRQWLRAGRRVWPSELLDDVDAGEGDGPHQVVAVGAVAAVAGLDPRRGALVHLHHLVSGITTAAVRLQGLDPFALQAVQRQLSPLIGEMAAEAAAIADQPLDLLPARGGPLAELHAQHHAGWETRLFQS